MMLPFEILVKIIEQSLVPFDIIHERGSSSRTPMHAITSLLHIVNLRLVSKGFDEEVRKTLKARYTGVFQICDKIPEKRMPGEYWLPLSFEDIRDSRRELQPIDWQADILRAKTTEIKYNHDGRNLASVFRELDASDYPSLEMMNHVMSSPYKAYNEMMLESVMDIAERELNGILTISIEASQVVQERNFATLPQGVRRVFTDFYECKDKIGMVHGKFVDDQRNFEIKTVATWMKFDKSCPLRKPSKYNTSVTL